jgi:hypothetical protein
MVSCSEDMNSTGGFRRPVYFGLEVQLDSCDWLTGGWLAKIQQLLFQVYAGLFSHLRGCGV